MDKLVAHGQCAHVFFKAIDGHDDRGVKPTNGLKPEIQTPIENAFAVVLHVGQCEAVGWLVQHGFDVFALPVGNEVKPHMAPFGLDQIILFLQFHCGRFLHFRLP